MIGYMDDGALARIRDDPGSDAGQELLGRVLYEVIEDVPKMTSTDVGRLRALARLLSDVAPYQPAAQRPEAKGCAAEVDKIADFLDELGRIAAREFGGW